MSMNTNKNHQHPTRTYRGRPACAGSAAEGVLGAQGTRLECSVCGRDDLSSIIAGGTWTTRVNTHLHPMDLAGNKPRQFKDTPAAAPKPAWRPNPQQALAIQAFYQDRNADTFTAMAATGAADENYVRWAREQGWE